MWTNCRAHQGNIVLRLLSTLLETFDVFGLNVAQKTNKIEQNSNELFGPPGKRNCWALSTLLDKIYVFRLDAVQSTMKTEKTVNEMLGSPRKRSFLANYQHFLLSKSIYIFRLDAFQKIMKN